METELMSFLKALQGNLSISFILNVPFQGLKDVFEDEPFKQIPTPIPRGIQAPTGVIIGPPEMPIATIGETRITYVSDRYRLQFVGPLSDILNLKEVLPRLFEKQEYSLDDMARYCELMVDFQPIELPKVAGSLPSNINVKNIERLNEVCGYEMKPFRLSLSNSDTPLNDEWFNVTLQPDVNRPHHQMLIQIVKRTPKFEEMRIFLGKLEAIIGAIREMLSSA